MWVDKHTLGKMSNSDHEIVKQSNEPKDDSAIIPASPFKQHCVYHLENGGGDINMSWRLDFAVIPGSIIK